MQVDQGNIRSRDWSSLTSSEKQAIMELGPHASMDANRTLIVAPIHEECNLHQRLKKRQFLRGCDHQLLSLVISFTTESGSNGHGDRILLVSSSTAAASTNYARSLKGEPEKSIVCQANANVDQMSLCLS